VDMIKYRIKTVSETKHFAQVKLHWWSLWKTIGKHHTGCGLYANNHLEYPKSFTDAKILCHGYNDWIFKTTITKYYTEVIL